MPADINVTKQIEYWKNGSNEDLQAASTLLKKNHVRHGMIILHLALEKMLKAHVCKVIQDVPPRILDLVRLSDIAKIKLSQKQIDFLADINAYNLEGHFPEYGKLLISSKEADAYLTQSAEFILWLTKQL